MSDYKDIITGTLKSLVGKAKEVAESDSVKNIVDKVKVAAENSPVRDIYEPVAGKAKAYGGIAKLSLEINGGREELKRVYAEIGQLYFEQTKDAPEGFYTGLFKRAEAIMADISAKEELLASLKAEVAPAAAESEADIEVEIAEFEEVVDETAADGAGETPVDEQ